MTVAVGGQDEQEGMMQVQVEGNNLKGKEIIHRDYFDDGTKQFVVFLARDKTFGSSPTSKSYVLTCIIICQLQHHLPHRIQEVWS